MMVTAPHNSQLGAPLECPICLDTVAAAPDTWARFPCSHGCCRPCLGDLVRLSSRPVGSGMQALACPLCRKLAVAPARAASVSVPSNGGLWAAAGVGAGAAVGGAAAAEERGDEQRQEDGVVVEALEENEQDDGEEETQPEPPADNSVLPPPPPPPPPPPAGDGGAQMPWARPQHWV
jgi:hypothetical protein